MRFESPVHKAGRYARLIRRAALSTGEANLSWPEMRSRYREKRSRRRDRRRGRLPAFVGALISLSEMKEPNQRLSAKVCRENDIHPKTVQNKSKLNNKLQNARILVVRLRLAIKAKMPGKTGAWFLEPRAPPKKKRVVSAILRQLTQFAAVNGLASKPERVRPRGDNSSQFSEDGDYSIGSDIGSEIDVDDDVIASMKRSDDLLRRLQREDY